MVDAFEPSGRMVRISRGARSPTPAIPFAMNAISPLAGEDWAPNARFTGEAPVSASNTKTARPR